MNGGGRGKGAGGGQGEGKVQGRRTRTYGAALARTKRFRICPHCGHRDPHKRGMPCVERKCPKCGTAMTGR
jgi:hypothetical protein